MAIRSWQAIREEMIQDVIAHLTGVTYIDDRSNIQGIITPIAKAIQREEYDLELARRSLDIFLAEGTALDALGQARGVYRLGPGKAGVTLQLYGAAGAYLDVGAVVKANNGALYTVVSSDATSTGSTLPAAYDAIRDPSFMKTATAVANEAGTGGNALAYTITQIMSGSSNPSPAIGITNIVPAYGGETTEPDEVYRQRIIRSTGLLNSRTRDKYLALAQQANPDVLRTWVSRGNAVNGVLVKLVRRSPGTVFTADEKETIRTFMLPYVFPDAPEIQDMNFVKFGIDMSITIDPSYTLANVRNAMLDRLVYYVNPSLWPFGVNVRDEILLSICAQTTGVRTFDKDGFLIQSLTNRAVPTTITGDVQVPVSQIPLLSGMVLRDSMKGSSVGTDGGGVTVVSQVFPKPLIPSRRNYER
jgi:hypothetical protein